MSFPLSDGLEEGTTGFPYVGEPHNAGGEPAITLGSSLIYEAYFNAINPALYQRFQPMLSAWQDNPPRRRLPPDDDRRGVDCQREGHRAGAQEGGRWLPVPVPKGCSSSRQDQVPAI